METDEGTRRTWGMDVRIPITGLLLAGAFCAGAFEGIVGPTLVDLKDQFVTSYEPLTRAFLARSITFLLGSYVTSGCYAHRRAWMDAYLAAMLLVGALASAAAPWSPSLVVLAVLYALVGLSSGSVHSGVYLYTLGLWGKTSAAPYFIVSSGVPLGKACAALIARPFLSSHVPPINVTHAAICRAANRTPFTSCEVGAHKGNSKLYVPYTINGCFGLLAMFAFLILALKRNSENSLTANETVLSPSKTHFIWKLMLTILLVILQMLTSIRAFLLATFYLSITHESDLSLPKTAGSTLTFLLLLFDGISRVLFGVFNKCIGLRISFGIQLTVGTAGVGVLTFYGLQSVQVLWILTPLHVLALGAVRSTTVALSNRSVEITGLTMAFIESGMAAGLFLSTWIGGATMDRDGPQYTLYVWFAVQCTFVVFAVALLAVTSYGGDRFANEELQNKKKEEEEKAGLLENDD